MWSHILAACFVTFSDKQLPWVILLTIMLHSGTKTHTIFVKLTQQRRSCATNKTVFIFVMVAAIMFSPLWKEPLLIKQLYVGQQWSGSTTGVDIIKRVWAAVSKSWRILCFKHSVL